MANLTENSQIKSFAQLRGHTRIWKNDELVFDEDNAIIGGIQNSGATSPTGLKAYLARSLDENIDRAINFLFNTSNESGNNYNLLNKPTVDAAFTGTHDGQTVYRDGIIVGNFDATANFGANQTAYAMETTSVTESSVYGRKWRGVLTATTAISASHAVLGYRLKSDTRNSNIAVNGQYLLANVFTTPFANQTFQTITLASGDSLTIDWEIYIA